MKLSIYLLSIFTILTAASCVNEDDTTASVASCCEISAIDEAIGDGYIFVPNIFTPNNDGINDNFFAFSHNISQINKFEIKTEAGDLVLESMNFAPTDFDKGWDGTYNGEFQKGLYSINIEVQANDGTVGTFTGKVCCLPCGNDDTPDPLFDAISNCVFATQHNGLGSFDASIATLETLPCLE